VAVESEEDLRSFFSEDEFGETVTVDPKDGSPSYDLTTIHDLQGEPADTDGSVEVSFASKEVLVPAIDAPELRAGDRMTVRGTTYKVLEAPPRPPDGAVLAVRLLRV